MEHNDKASEGKTGNKDKELSVKEFIEIVLMRDIRRMVYECKLHYLSFSVISQGIEFLGACLDELKWDDPDQSEKRFNKALKKLFQNKYQRHSTRANEQYLYKGLRCGLIHMMRPQNKVFLTHREESKRDGTSHLKKHNDKLILVLEDFYDDFERACKDVIAKIDAGKITNKKVQKSYLRILDMSQPAAQPPKLNSKE